MYSIAAVALLSLASTASGAISAAQNFNPVTITVSSAPFDVLATPITPDAPYSQAAYQCNVTGDSRYPPYASGTFPLNISVPVGQRVRVIFANGNLNGATVTQQGEPGVIVQQGGSPIVQQAGGASPIVQPAGSPIVQQSVSSPAALVVQQGPTVVQQPTYPQAATVPVGPNPPVTPPTPSPTPPTPAAPTPTSPAPVPPTPVASPPPAPLVPTPVTSPSPPPPTASPPPPAASPPPPTPTVSPPPVASPPPKDASPPPKDASPPPKDASPPPKDSSPPPTPSPPPSPCKDEDKCNKDLTVSTGRKLLQDTVPGGPNNGQVEYVALASANTVPGFFAGSTQFGVPYVEFTASEAARGLVASFKGALEVAQVVGGVPLYPFRPNPSLSPECQVNVNFKVL